MDGRDEPIVFRLRHWHSIELDNVIRLRHASGRYRRSCGDRNSPGANRIACHSTGHCASNIAATRGNAREIKNDINAQARANTAKRYTDKYFECGASGNKDGACRNGGRAARDVHRNRANHTRARDKSCLRETNQDRRSSYHRRPAARDRDGKGALTECNPRGEGK